ncbi:3039_t:CDS:1, partial [Scutellospora calospora]
LEDVFSCSVSVVKVIEISISIFEEVFFVGIDTVKVEGVVS